ncbi:hypothetical protein J4227_07785 [Candidatus Woesearchaeota archaeon]|nr:hypothetical protein [Candidatus Woesearchaeota archaeon]
MVQQHSDKMNSPEGIADLVRTANATLPNLGNAFPYAQNMYDAMLNDPSFMERVSNHSHAVNQAKLMALSHLAAVVLPQAVKYAAHLINPDGVYATLDGATNAASAVLGALLIPFTLAFVNQALDKLGDIRAYAYEHSYIRPQWHEQKMAAQN